MNSCCSSVRYILVPLNLLSCLSEHERRSSQNLQLILELLHDERCPSQGEFHKPIWSSQLLMSCEASCELQVPSRRNIMGSADHLGSSWAASWLQGIMAAAAAARRMSGAVTSCYYCNTTAIATTILLVSSLLVISSVVVVNAVTDAGDGEKKKKEKTGVFGWDAWACSTLFDFQATNSLSGKINCLLQLPQKPNTLFWQEDWNNSWFSNHMWSNLVWFCFVCCLLQWLLWQTSIWTYSNHHSCGTGRSMQLLVLVLVWTILALRIGWVSSAPEPM